MVKASVAAVAASAALLLAPPAYADQPDTRVPNGSAVWCWGGQGMVAFLSPFCNGAPFPDGSYLRQTGYMQGMQFAWNPPECVDASGAPAPGACKI